MPRSIAARTALLAVIAAATLALAGCSGGEQESPPAEDTFTSTPVESEEPTDGGSEEQNAALDTYVALEMGQRDTVLETYADLYSDFTVEAEYPNTIVFTYTYVEPMDPDLAGDAFADVAQMLDDQVTSAVFPVMEQTGVEAPNAKFVYLNPDGYELWTHLVESP